MNVLIFSVDDKRYGVNVGKVIRVMWALEITPMPETIDAVLGVFDLHGRMIPVVSLRRLLSLAEKPIDTNDVLILIDVHGHQMALLCDEMIGTMDLEVENPAEIEALFPGLVTSDVVKLDDRLIPILDMDELIEHESAQRIVKKSAD